MFASCALVYLFESFNHHTKTNTLFYTHTQTHTHAHQHAYVHVGTYMNLWDKHASLYVHLTPTLSRFFVF